MKILLIVPRFNLGEKKDYNYTFPLGLAMISSSIRKAGFDLSVMNLNHKEGSIKELINNELHCGCYDIVLTGHIGIGCGVIKEMIGIVREHPSHPKIILGGAILSEPELIAEALKPDYAVVGEGEEAIIELLKKIVAHDEIPQIIYGTPVQNLDELPYPDYEGFGFKEYLDNQYTNRWYYCNPYDNPRVYPLLASRSCPFHCTFCYHYGNGMYRERSMKEVLKEVQWAVDNFRINILCIYDDLFSAKVERIYEFCNGIEQINKTTPQLIKWTCQLSVLTVTPELLKRMKDAGCTTISYGFESYSPIVLKSMRKPITPELMDKAFKMTVAEGINVQGNFIFGDVAETKETAQETLDYWKNNSEGQIGLTFISPYPNSEIYQSCVRRGIIKDKIKFMENDMNSSVPTNMTETMTDEEFRKLDEEIQDAQMKYGRFVVPKKVEKGSQRGYNLHVVCPYCGEYLIYDNCWLQNRLVYFSAINCRECSMRFNVLSTLFNLSRIGNMFPKIVRLYRKTLRMMWKR